MKIFALFLVIFVLVSSAVALKHAVCGLQTAADGDSTEACVASMRRWSYKSSANECVEFIYGGCGGNDNRFKSQKECEDKCKEKKYNCISPACTYL